MAGYSAYTEIYDRYVWVLLDHAYNKLRNREESKDVVQEARCCYGNKKKFYLNGCFSYTRC